MEDDKPLDTCDLDRIRAWRRRSATKLGFEFVDAERIAEGTVDLHELALLIDRGARRELALRILE